MSETHLINHPLINDKLAQMRDENTSSGDFRRLLREITSLMCYEVSRDFPTELKKVQTPVALAEVPVLADTDICLVPILRAGLGMVDGFLDVMPFASVGHLGMYRDEQTHEPVSYYCNLPSDIADSLVIVVDPMLATGGSAVDAVAKLKENGCTDIRMVNLLAAPEGIEKFKKFHPDVDVYVAAIDQGLNDKAYIVPGLGDAGDRFFGTVS